MTLNYKDRTFHVCNVKSAKDRLCIQSKMTINYNERTCEVWMAKELKHSFASPKMSLIHNVHIMHQFWRDFKRPFTPSDTILDTDKTMSTLQWTHLEHIVTQ